MKHWKRSVSLLLAIAAATAFSGCQEVIKVDPEEDQKQIVATVNGEEITKDRYQTSYDNYEAQYQMYGQSVAGMEEQILDSLIEYDLLKQEAKKAGYYELTPEREEEFETMYAEEVAALKENYFRPTAESELGETATEEEIVARTEELFTADVANQGLSLEELRQDYLDSAVVNWMYQDVIDKVTVSDEDLQSWYDTNLAEQETAFKEDPTMYDQYNMYNPPALYVPSGYKDVKHILISFDEQIQTDIATAKSEQDEIVAQIGELMRDEQNNLAEIDKLRKENETLVSKLNELKSAARTKAEEVLAKVQAGEDFDTLMKEYSDDDGSMADEGYLKNGMRVGEANTLYVPEFTAAVNELDQGEVSGLVETTYGFHIIKNIQNVPEGAVPLADVKEAAETQALAAKQGETWQSQVDEWKGAADIQKNVELLTDNSGNYVDETADK